MSTGLKIGAALGLMVLLALGEWAFYRHAYNVGFAAEKALVEAAQKKIEAETKVKTDAAEKKADAAQKATQVKQTELDEANAKLKITSDTLSATGASLDSVLRKYADASKAAAALRKSVNPGPDWIGLFSQCVATSEDLARQLNQSTTELSSVAGDASRWADALNEAQAYIAALPLDKAPAAK